MALIPWRILPRWLLHTNEVAFFQNYIQNNSLMKIAAEIYSYKPFFLTACYIYQPVKFLKLLKQRNILFLDIAKNRQ